MEYEERERALTIPSKMRVMQRSHNSVTKYPCLCPKIKVHSHRFYHQKKEALFRRQKASNASL